MKYFEKLKYLIETEGCCGFLGIATDAKSIGFRDHENYIMIEVATNTGTYHHLLTQYDEFFHITGNEVYGHEEMLKGVFDEIMTAWDKSRQHDDITCEEVRSYAPEVRL